MKIAVIGAHRVGKTTLAELVHESLPGYAYLPEPYVEMEETGHLFSETPNVEDFFEQLEYSIDQVSESGDNVIFDRCPLDILAYVRAMNDSMDIGSLYRTVQGVMEGIDLLVFVPIENPDRISCAESDRPELRSRVNEILEDWIGDFGMETLEVQGTLPARRDQVINKITKVANRNLLKHDGDESKKMST